MKLVKNFFFVVCLFVVCFCFVTVGYSQSYVLGSIGDKVVNEGDLLEFNIEIPASLGNNVDWTVEGLPEGRFYEVPAFPGAEGFGAKSIGGRGGKVVKVTNLNADGEGSLKWALEQEGPKIVVFSVSGVIDTLNPIYIRDSRVTIAGQTAPGAGITIPRMFGSLYSDWTADISSFYRKMFHDYIVRFLRIRPNYFKTYDNNADCAQFGDVDRLILDHMTGSWSMDECFDLSASRDISFQWNSVEESDFNDMDGERDYGHNYGMIMGYAGKDASLHHNLFAHHYRRSPLSGLETMDHRNNVIYDLEAGLLWHPTMMNEQRPGELFKANVVGNYFKNGPSAPKDQNDPSYYYAVINAASAKFYSTGNYFTWGGGYLDLWASSLPKGVIERVSAEKQETEYPVTPVQTQTAEEAYDLVLAHAGCLPKDYTSERIENEVKTGTGSFGRTAPPNEDLMYGLSPGVAPVDSDDDGMPDSWETAHGLNPYDGTDYNRKVLYGESVMKYNGNTVAGTQDRYRGYTYIEYYIDELADQLILKELYANGLDETDLPGYNQKYNPTLSWVPKYTESGTYEVTITATNGNQQISETFTIEVVNTNRRVEISPSRYELNGNDVYNNKKIFAGVEYVFEMYAKEPDGDDYVFEGNNLPEGVIINRTGALRDIRIPEYDVFEISWTPTEEQIGTHTLSFVASDGDLVDESSFDLRVFDTLTCDELGGEICTIAQTCNSNLFLFATDSNRCCSDRCVCTTDLQCDDGNICTTDICNAEGSCEYLFNSNPCDDGYFCTKGDYCSAGQCVSGNKDNNACLVGYGSCSSGICNPLLFPNTEMGCGSYQPSSCDESGGVILKMTFDGNMQDTSGRENHGTCEGTRCPTLTFDRQGNPNSAYEFEEGDQIVIGDKAVYNANDYTVAAWVYGGYEGEFDTQYYVYLVSKSIIARNNSLGMFIAYARLYSCGSTYPNVFGLKSLEKKWVHLAVSKKKINETNSVIEFFINGVSQGNGINGVGGAAGIVPNSVPNHYPLTIGTRSDGGKGFIGKIDDVYIFNHALNQDELNTVLDIKSQFETSSCISLGGVYCGVSELCTGSWLLANDTNMCCQGTCYAADATFHPADLNKNDNIEFGEVFSYTQKWLIGSVTLKQVLDVINMWRGNNG